MRAVTICVFFLFLTQTILGNELKLDSTSYKNTYSFQIGYPIPFSNITFKRFYDGIFDLKYGFSRKNKYASFGGDIGFCYFKISQKILDVTGKLIIFSPGLSASYEIKVIHKISIRPLIKFGYDFIFFSGTGANGNPHSVYRDGGLSLSPIVSLEYSINKNIALGIMGSYELIFQQFGYNSVLEESTTRIADFGIKIVYER